MKNTRDIIKPIPINIPGYTIDHCETMVFKNRFGSSITRRYEQKLGLLNRKNQGRYKYIHISENDIVFNTGIEIYKIFTYGVFIPSNF